MASQGKKANKISDKLSAKEEQFCHEFIIDLNASQAYSRAYKNANIRSCSVLAVRLLAKVSVREKIAALKKELSERALKSADEVIRELELVGFSRLSKFGTWDEFGFHPFKSDQVPDGAMAALESIQTQTTVLKSFGGQKAEDLEESEGGEKDDAPLPILLETTTKFKLHPKVEALKKLGERHGIFKGENKDVTVRVLVERNY